MLVYHCYFDLYSTGSTKIGSFCLFVLRMEYKNETVLLVLFPLFIVL